MESFELNRREITKRAMNARIIKPMNIIRAHRKKVCKNSANCDIIEVTQEADFSWQEEKENQ